jgi:hypothetical protein
MKRKIDFVKSLFQNAPCGYRCTDGETAGGNRYIGCTARESLGTNFLVASAVSKQTSFFVDPSDDTVFCSFCYQMHPVYRDGSISSPCARILVA